MKKSIEISSVDFTPKEIHANFMSWRNLDVEEATSANSILANFNSFFDIYFNLI